MKLESQTSNAWYLSSTHKIFLSISTYYFTIFVYTYRFVEASKVYWRRPQSLYSSFQGKNVNPRHMVVGKY